MREKERKLLLLVLFVSANHTTKPKIKVLEMAIPTENKSRLLSKFIGNNYINFLE